MCYYDRLYDRISAKTEKPLAPSDKPIQNFSTSEDPILQKVIDLSHIMYQMIKHTTKPTVYATDSILVALMSATRSIYSWDMIITKQGNTIVLDKREGTIFDYISVNENAIEPPTEDKESFNSNIALSMEATHVNRSFAQQVIKESEKLEFQNPSPFSAASPTSSKAYRYRKWELGENLSLVLRTHMDAAIQQSNGAEITKLSTSAYPASETQFITVNTLLEYDSRLSNTPDWRQKLDSMKGAVLAAEFKNNGVKLLKWTLESLLSGVDQMRVGFVSRTSPKDRKKHGIIGTGIYKPYDFLSQMNFDVGSGWGIVKTIADLCMNQLDDGKYILLKDANKPVMRLYSVPLDTFDGSVQEETAIVS